MIILFDIDGTLLDDYAAMRAGVAAIHAESCIGKPVNEFFDDWLAATERQIDRFTRGVVDFQGQRRIRIREVVDPSLDDSAADTLFSTYAAASEAAWTLFSDTLRCLDRLADYRLGVVSNGLGSQQRAKLQRTQIAERFDCAVISADLGERKPNEAIFRYACELMRVRPADAIYVGDRYDTDALGARGAGLMGVWLDRARTRTTGHTEPIVADLDEFAALAKRSG